MKKLSALLALMLFASCKAPAPARHMLAASGSTSNVVADTVAMRFQQAAATAPSGSLSIQNVAGTLSQVTDQGVVTAIAGGGGGGFPSTATALTKDNTGSPTGNIPLSGLGGPGSLWFAADGTPSKASAANITGLVAALPYASLATMSANTLLCNNTGSPATPISCTVAQAQAMGLGFAADTIVTINNSLGAPVNAWEHAITLPTTTAGSEASQADTKLLVAGAQVTAQSIRPNATLFRDGAFNASSIAFASSTASGLWWDSAQARTTVQVGTTVQGSYGFDNAGIIHAVGDVGGIKVSSAQDTGFTRSGVNGDMLLTSGRDFTFGPASAMATTATTGFVAVPAGAGPPTGSAAIPTGKGLLYIDATNSKMYISVAAGTWVILN